MAQYQFTTGKPLAIDLYAGLGGWTEGFLAEGYRVVGFDIEVRPYPAQLVIQDVLTLHGSQFKDAAVIVASPPCQNYSYLAMPWSRSTTNNSQAAKAMRRKWETEGPDNRLFDACFRIQREAIEAAGHYIPLLIENVRGAEPWVGRANWRYGSFFLWGDVPALMPLRSNSTGGGSWFHAADNPNAYCWRNNNRMPLPGLDGVKNGGDWFNSGANCSEQRKHSSRSAGRKMASAQIAKIPLPLSQHIAKCYKPEAE